MRINVSKKCSVLAIALFLVGCGQAVDLDPMGDIIGTARKVGFIPDKNPAGDSNDGPIDGIWARSSTTCASGERTNGNVSTYAFYVDNASVKMLLAYDSGIEVVVPLTFSYQAGNQVAVAKSGNHECRETTRKSKGFCNGYILPGLPTLIRYQKQSTTAVQFQFDKDSLCKLGASTSVLNAAPLISR